MTIKPALTLAGLTLVIAMSGASRGNESGVYNDGHTTIVRNGNSVSVITQSGDRSQADVRISRQPGRTTVYRRSGGNTAVITQSTTPTGIDPDQIIREWRERLGHTE